MVQLKLALALVSLVLGMILIAFVVSERGMALTLGMVVGVALALNGALRLWLAVRSEGEPPQGRSGDKGRV